ncbi:hypothetical protein RI129_012409 [Pyrocoelia pectoralis]|uniref:Sulfotransferase domain-containing protein n=1 Tax=Pyrocoelia pectoralis TaxID=417401 RepID=A0AAN7V661_9COLE
MSSAISSSDILTVAIHSYTNMAHNIRRIGNGNKIDRLLNETLVTEVRKGFVEVGSDNVCLPIYYEKYEKFLNKFEVRDSDIYLLAHPKTGTTWTQEMIWLIVNNLDYEGARQILLNRFPLLEAPIYVDDEVVDISALHGDDFITFINALPEPRCIKSHLHWSLLPEQIQNRSKKPKIISIFRNPEDTCVSFYYYCKLFEGYRGTFEEFCDLFLAGRLSHGPFWKLVLSLWNERENSNILFIKYIDMKNDLPSVIRKVAQFLGRNIDEDHIDKLTKHLSFDSMKKNPAVNLQPLLDTFALPHNLMMDEGAFIRRGIVDGYKSEMTMEQIQKFKKWTRENLVGSDFDEEVV